MEADLMNSWEPRGSRWREAGFSMVEMLMAAFILAIGLLGLATLQVMSLSVGRGSQSMNTALRLAERTMDQIELEGRLSWLNITNTNVAAPSALSSLSYVGKGSQYQGFDEHAQPVTSAPVGSKPPLSETVRYVMSVQEGAATNAGTGQMSDYVATVEFADAVGTSGTPVLRTVSVTRRVIHG